MATAKPIGNYCNETACHDVRIPSHNCAISDGDCLVGPMGQKHKQRVGRKQLL